MIDGDGIQLVALVRERGRGQNLYLHPVFQDGILLGPRHGCDTTSWSGGEGGAGRVK